MSPEVFHHHQSIDQRVGTIHLRRLPPIIRVRNMIDPELNSLGPVVILLNVDIQRLIRRIEHEVRGQFVIIWPINGRVSYKDCQTIFI